MKNHVKVMIMYLMEAQYISKQNCDNELIRNLPGVVMLHWVIRLLERGHTLFDPEESKENHRAGFFTIYIIVPSYFFFMIW